jgi:MFS family permease
LGNRWLILAALTLARTAMGFQFQVVTAAGSDLREAFNLSSAAQGLLIGLYLLPGITLAIPGGWLGQRIGDKRIALAGLAMMAAGAALCAWTDSWAAMLAGRALSGFGAVLLNVLLTKMTSDWFESSELTIAMGILVSSWPLGIALAMVSLPDLTHAAGWQAAFLTTAVAAALCFVLVLLVYRPAHAPTSGTAHLAITLSRNEFALALLVGSAWALYNIGFIVLMAFGPAFLVAEGLGEIDAQATASLIGWLVIPIIAAAGWIVARSGRPTLLMTGGLVATAGLVCLLPPTGGPSVLFALIGLTIGFPAPVLMAMLAQTAPSERRAIAAGVFFTCYYLGMAVGSPIAGWFRDVTGAASAPIWFAGIVLLAALVPTALFRRLQARAA